MPAHVERHAARGWRDRFPVWTEMIDQGQSMDIPRQMATGDPYPLRGLVGFGLNYRMFPDSEGWLDAVEKLDFVRGRRPLPHRQRQVRRHRPSRLRLGRAERGALLSAEVRHLHHSRSSSRWVNRAPTSTSSSVWPRSWGCGLPGAETAAGDRLGGFLPNGAPDFGAAFEAALDWILEPSGMQDRRAEEAPGRHAGAEPLPGRPSRSTRRTGFPTPSGKMEFSSSILEKHSDHPGIDGLPIYNEPKLSPVSTPERGRRLPARPRHRGPAAHVHPLPHLPAPLDPQPAAATRPWTSIPADAAASASPRATRSSCRPRPAPSG